MRVLAVIPARGGSKGLPRKNLLPLAGKPLLLHTMELAQQVRARGLLADVVVSTEDAEIKAVAEARLPGCVLDRPAALATDEAAAEGVLRHALHGLEERTGRPYSHVLLLQPTSPLRRTQDVVRGLDLAASSGADKVVSVMEVRDSPYWMYVQGDGGALKPLLDDARHGRRRQELPPVVRPNGAVYVYTRAALVQPPVPLKLVGFEMDAATSVDIDGPLDLQWAEFLLAQQPPPATAAPGTSAPTS